MAFRKTSFAPNEWYHCYNRGVDKRRVFYTKNDYERFVQTLYLCNTNDSLRRDNLKRKSKSELFEIPRTDTLVRIAAWCLMPNHFHLLLQETAVNGISRYMHKVGTAYSMYFNLRNERVGGLFLKPFRSKHVDDDRYFKRVAQYIHLNPIELFEPGWKSGNIKNYKTVENRLKKYPYSSLSEYSHLQRPEKSILDKNATNLLLEGLPPLNQILEEAAAYYQELS